jgi:hypothetical protein
MPKAKTCRNCGWFKKDCGEVYRNFYMNCTNPEMKKGTACGPDSSEPFRYHKSGKFSVMDKVIISVCAMLLMVKLYFLVEIIYGVKQPGEQAIGIMVLLFANAYIAITYPKHRHEYR